MVSSQYISKLEEIEAMYKTGDYTERHFDAGSKSCNVCLGRKLSKFVLYFIFLNNGSKIVEAVHKECAEQLLSPDFFENLKKRNAEQYQKLMLKIWAKNN